MNNTDFTDEQRDFIRGCIYDELIDGKGGKVFFPRDTEEWEVLVAMIHPLHHTDQKTEWVGGKRTTTDTPTALDNEGVSYLWDWFGERTDDALEQGDEKLAAQYLDVINSILSSRHCDTYKSLHQWAHSIWQCGEIIPLDDDDEDQE